MLEEQRKAAIETGENALKRAQESHQEESKRERESHALRLKTLQESEVERYQAMRTRLLNEVGEKDSLIKELQSGTASKDKDLHLKNG